MAFPLAEGAPLVSMGAPGAGVNAWYWRADEKDAGRNVVAEGIGTSRTLDQELKSQSRQDQIAGIIYPRLGEIVRSYVASAVRDMMETINRRLESGLGQNRCHFTRQTETFVVLIDHQQPSGSGSRLTEA